MSDLEPSLIVDLLHQSMDDGKSPSLVVVSDSMAPLIRSGDQVQIAPITHEALVAGDVVVVSGSQELLTHRFWGLLAAENELKLITKGDRPQHFDRPRNIDTLVGLVISRKRNRRLLNIRNGIGRWLSWLLSRLGTLEIRLFSRAIPVGSGGGTRLYDRDGIFAETTRDNFGHLFIRRCIYAVAKSATFVVQLFDKPV